MHFFITAQTSAIEMAHGQSSDLDSNKEIMLNIRKYNVNLNLYRQECDVPVLQVKENVSKLDKRA